MTYRLFFVFAMFALAASAAKAGLEVVVDDSKPTVEETEPQTTDDSAVVEDPVVAEAAQDSAVETPDTTVEAPSQVGDALGTVTETVAEEPPTNDDEEADPQVIDALELEEIVDEEAAVEEPADEVQVANLQPAAEVGENEDASTSPSDIELPELPPEPADDDTGSVDQSQDAPAAALVESACPAPACCVPNVCQPVVCDPVCAPACNPCGGHGRVWRRGGCRLFRCW